MLTSLIELNKAQNTLMSEWRDSGVDMDDVSKNLKGISKKLKDKLKRVGLKTKKWASKVRDFIKKPKCTQLEDMCSQLQELSTNRKIFKFIVSEYYFAHNLPGARYLANVDYDRFIPHFLKDQNFTLPHKMAVQLYKEVINRNIYHRLF
eukprot:NODE_746_length_4249_cov_0.268916.p4 type:complete len:149 gc:universal NODE_746_length_4249_cov_0.268916:3644-4090(+)